MYSTDTTRATRAAETPAAACSTESATARVSESHESAGRRRLDRGRHRPRHLRAARGGRVRAAAGADRPERLRVPGPVRSDDRYAAAGPGHRAHPGGPDGDVQLGPAHLGPALVLHRSG